MLVEKQYKIIGIKKKEVICEKCNVNMNRTNINVLSNPIKFEFECAICGNKEYYIEEEIGQQFVVKQVENLDIEI